MGIVAVAARASRSEFPGCTCSRRTCGRWPAQVEHGVTVRADWPEIVGRVDLIVRFKAARELLPAKQVYRWPEQPTQNQHKEVPGGVQHAVNTDGTALRDTHRYGC
jgi:hypothetical protein